MEFMRQRDRAISPFTLEYTMILIASSRSSRRRRALDAVFSCAISNGLVASRSVEYPDPDPNVCEWRFISTQKQTCRSFPGSNSKVHQAHSGWLSGFLEQHPRMQVNKLVNLVVVVFFEEYPT